MLQAEQRGGGVAGDSHSGAATVVGQRSLGTIGLWVHFCPPTLPTTFMLAFV